MPEIVRTSRKLCQRLSEAALSKDNKPVEVDLLTSQVVIDVILYFLLGRRIDYNVQVFRYSTQTMLEMAFHCAMKPLHFVLRYLPFTKDYEMVRKRNAAWKAIDDVMEDEIQQVLREMNGEETTMKTSSPRQPGSALVSMLAKEPRFRAGGMESLAAEVPVFVLAGFETTAHGLSFAFGLLALHPELADRIAQEGRAVWDKLVVDSHDDDVATELIRQALEQAPTARRFFLETLRLYPLVPTLPGKCLQDVTVTTSQGEVYGLPQGTQVLFTNFVLNRQQAGEALTSSLWERPPEEQPFTNTFNTGAHVCPGKALSLLEARVFLLMAAIQFEFIIPREHKENPMDFMDHIMLKPKEGMPLLIRERAFNKKT